MTDQYYSYIFTDWVGPFFLYTVKISPCNASACKTFKSIEREKALKATKYNQ